MSIVLVGISNMSYSKFNIGEILRFCSEKRNFIHEAKAVVLKEQSPLKQARPVFSTF